MRYPAASPRGRRPPRPYPSLTFLLPSLLVSPHPSPHSPHPFTYSTWSNSSKYLSPYSKSKDRGKKNNFSWPLRCGLGPYDVAREARLFLVLSARACSSLSFCCVCHHSVRSPARHRPDSTAACSHPPSCSTKSAAKQAQYCPC